LGFLGFFSSLRKSSSVRLVWNDIFYYVEIGICLCENYLECSKRMFCAAWKIQKI